MRSIKWIIGFAFLVVVTGCSMNKLREEIVEAKETLRQLKGVVTVADGACEDCQIILALLDENTTLGSYKILSHPQEFEFIGLQGINYILAFADTNQDRALQKQELVAYARLTPSQDPMRYEPVTLQLGKDHSHLPKGVADLMFIRSNTDQSYPIQYGTRTTIDNPNFNPEISKLGMWQPLQFMKDGHAGVYLLNDYDPQKIPVLFVHGIDGNPSQFKTLIDAMDPDTYQFVVFYYPSGFRLHTLANGLYSILTELQNDYKFNTLHLVAHSMGGLVSREYLNICSRRGGCDYLGKYVSIATPYGGHASAEMGVKYAPVVMPVWKDMAPSSDFISELFSYPLPNNMKHHLFFGYDNGGGGDSSDGVIVIASQLRLEAQTQAVSVSGYNDTHVGLLSNEHVLSELNAFLKAAP